MEIDLLTDTHVYAKHDDGARCIFNIDMMRDKSCDVIGRVINNKKGSEELIYRTSYYHEFVIKALELSGRMSTEEIDKIRD